MPSEKAKKKSDKLKQSPKGEKTMKKLKRSEYTTGIEKELMATIVLAVKHNKTTEERVKLISQTYLSFANEPLVEVLIRKLRELGKLFREVRDVANKYWAKYLNERGKIALSRTRVYLRNGNIDKALITVKGGTHYV